MWEEDKYIPIGDTEPEWEALQVKALRVQKEFDLSPGFRQRVDDLGVSVNHKKKGKLVLGDVFVYPDLTRINHARSTSGKLLRANHLFPNERSPHHYLITGGDRVAVNSYWTPCATILHAADCFIASQSRRTWLGVR